MPTLVLQCGHENLRANMATSEYRRGHSTPHLEKVIGPDVVSPQPDQHLGPGIPGGRGPPAGGGIHKKATATGGGGRGCRSISIEVQRSVAIAAIAAVAVFAAAVFAIAIRAGVAIAIAAFAGTVVATAATTRATACRHGIVTKDRSAEHEGTGG